MDAADDAWADPVPEGVTETSRVSITRGMANAMARGGALARTCDGCGLGIPRYRGRYPTKCPSCDGALAHPDGDADVTEALKAHLRRAPAPVAWNDAWLNEGAPTTALPSNAVTFLRPVAQKKVNELLRGRFVFLGDNANRYHYAATFATASVPHDPRVEFRVDADDFHDETGEPMGWSVEIRDVYGRSPDPYVKSRLFYHGLGSTVQKAVAALERGWQKPAVFEAVATAHADVTKARAAIMASAAKGIGQRLASVEVKRRYHGFYLMARDVTGNYWTSMDDDAPVTGDEAEWLVSVADGRTIEWASPRSWVKESARGPVVAVSLVPRLNTLIESGTQGDKPYGEDESCSRPTTVPFDVVEKTVPGGVAGLAMFLEGPVGENTYFRLEGPMEPVLIFEMNHVDKVVTIYATESPTAALGSDPRESIVGTHVSEADDYDEVVFETLDAVTRSKLERAILDTAGDVVEARELTEMSNDVLVFFGQTHGVVESLNESDFVDSDEALSLKPTAGYILSPRPQGATRAHGAFRFRIGANRNRKPRNDLAQAIQNRRNARRGLASRIKAAKRWHQGVSGQELHKSLGRYNTGNHRGEAAEMAAVRDQAAAEAANESITGLVPSRVLLDVDLPPSLNYDRTEMPQLNPVFDFVEYLRGMGVLVTQEEVAVKSLNGSQDVDPDKVRNMAALDVDKLRAPPIVVSADHFILDGHHRWAALYYLGPLNTIIVYRVMLPFADLLNLAKQWPGATYKQVGESVMHEVHKPEDRVRPLGGKWAVRTFGDTTDYPVLFPTKTAAVDMARRNELMVKDTRGVTDDDETRAKASLARNTKVPQNTKLSKVVRKSNMDHEPPGGWNDSDRVGGRGVSEAVHSTILAGVPERSVDDIFDALLRRLVVIESTDVLEDVEFTDRGSIYLFFDPSLSPAEMEEIIRSLQSEEPAITLIASPDKSLPGETASCDWWVMYLAGETNEGQEPVDPMMYAREPGQAAAPKQQMVVQAQTTLDAIAASVDTSKLVQAAAEKQDTSNTETTNQ